MAKVDYGTLPPIPSRDANGRLVATRVGKVIDNNLRTYAALTAAGVFIAAGTALPGYPALVLNDVRVDFPAQGDSSPRLIESYIEADNSFTQVGPDIIDSDLNGLRRVRRTFVAKAGTALPTLTVGITAGPSPTLLASYSTEGSDNVVTRLSVTYLEPGVISKSTDGGPSSLPGTIRHTWQVWAMTFAESGMPGLLISDTEANAEGYPVRAFTTLTKGLSGSVTDDTIATYEDNIEITRHGTVQIGVDGASAGSQTPYLVQVSPTSGVVKATVTVALASSATAPAPVAFNLDTLQVSILAKTRTVRYIGSDVGETVTEHVYASQIGIDHTVLRGYVIASATGSGTEYQFSYNSAINDDGDSIIGEAFQSHIYRTITLSGSDTAPVTTGVWRREVEPAFTAADGTAYFRVTTWTI